mgnify:CR=1 FL=1
MIIVENATKWKIAILICALIFLITSLQLGPIAAPKITITNDTRVQSEEVEYFENAKGFFARPVLDGTYPGVIMIHERWGLNSNIRDMARQLASFGYNVLAVDLYQGNVASTSDEATQLVAELNQTLAIDNMKAARQFLKEKGSPVFASLGWGFGGGQSLQLALSGEPIDATVIYYGSLADDLSAIKKPVLGFFGGKDTTIPITSINAFESKLNELNVTNEIHVYPSAGGAFANPTGSGYAPQETEDAWIRTLDFLNKYLRS